MSMSGEMSLLTWTMLVAGRMAENFAVSAADFFPLGDIDDVDARAHDVFEGGSCTG